VYSCFRTIGAKVLGIFFILMERQFHRNESSWNVRSRGTKVPRERMFQGTKVFGTFAPKERKWSEERKFHESKSSLWGLFAPGNENAEERKGLDSTEQFYTAIRSICWGHATTRDYNADPGGNMQIAVGIGNVILWNSLPDYVVDTDNLDKFKTRIDEFWQHQEVLFNY